MKTYLFLLVALLAQVLSSPGHLGSAHGVFFGGEMFLDLRFCVAHDVQILDRSPPSSLYRDEVRG